ncbi:MAG: MATE family efflux transporter [Sphaerochaetaceae bacterium]|nr:MATE family efflux transporter [Sphaerochaetaceae bacterium]
MAHAVLSQKDERFRAFALSGNMWRVVLSVCFPLAVFQGINHLFTILDTLMASHVSAESVSTVAYLSQLQIIVSAIGQGLAMGGSIKISEAYGAGDYELVKKRLSTLVAMCGVIGLAVACALPFTPALLRLTATPERFIEIGARYFIVTLVATIFSFFNAVYIAIERARGNSNRILLLNTMTIVLKLALTAMFVYMMNADIVMIAVATVMAQGTLFIIAFRNMTKKDDVFSFSKEYVSFKKDIVGPILKISFPVIVEKSAFAMGKTVINSMVGQYGMLTVGALGVSNNMNGMVTGVQNGFQDGGSAIISQNRGGGKKERILSAFKKILVINLCIGSVGFLLLNMFAWPFSRLFANSVAGFDHEFQAMIVSIFRYDSISCVTLALSTSTMALLFGLGYTKLTLFINFCRVFVFRIPVLWWLQNYTDYGSESAGIVMGVSNVLVGILAVIVAVSVVRKLNRNDNIGTNAKNG